MEAARLVGGDMDAFYTRTHYGIDHLTITDNAQYPILKQYFIVLNIV